MLVRSKRRRFAIVVLLAIFAIAIWLQVGIEASLIPVYADICEKNQYTGNKDCSTYYSPLVFLWHVAKFLEDHAGAITAIATGFISYFTYTLYQATDHLKRLAREQEKTARTHERAYIVCGGLFGVQKSDARKYINDARDFQAPWRMQIHNYGRTPGFIKKIEWGVCPKGEFREDIPVSRIIKEEMLKNRMKPAVDVQEVFAPLGDRPIPYRHVSTERIVGEVFFGKITYEDVFGDEHYSTFALVHDESHTTPIGKSFSDDWK